METSQRTVRWNVLIQRINRRLIWDQRILVPSQGPAKAAALGHYHIVQVVDRHVDPKKLGRKLGALSSDEVVVWTPDRIANDARRSL